MAEFSKLARAIGGGKKIKREVGDQKFKTPNWEYYIIDMWLIIWLQCETTVLLLRLKKQIYPARKFQHISPTFYSDVYHQNISKFHITSHTYTRQKNFT